MKRRAALMTLACLCSACAAVVGPDLPSSNAALFDRVWNDLDLHYSFFVIKSINWDSLGGVYRPRAVAAQTSDNLAPVLVDLLSNLHDEHVELEIGGNVYTTSSSPYPNLFDPTITFSKYVESVGGYSSGIDYGLATPTVGYIRFQTFEGTGWTPEIDTALAQLGPTTSLIIDVRHNGGGLVDNAVAIAGRFADRTTTVAYVRYRNGRAHTDFTAPIEQTVSPAGAQRFSGNVYVLTNRNTYSAAEFFVLAMQAFGRTTVVGDTTGGQTGSPFARELQNGWMYQFSESIEYTRDGRAFEGIGLPPDVPIQSTRSEINQLRDAQLERAIALAMSNNSSGHQQSRRGAGQLRNPAGTAVHNPRVNRSLGTER